MVASDSSMLEASERSMVEAKPGGGSSILERRQSCKVEEGLVECKEKEKEEVQEKMGHSRSSSSASDEGVIMDRSCYEAVREEVGDVRTMLLRLKRMLHEADTVNPFDSDISLRPGNLYANLVLSESEQLVTAAAAIDKLSAAAAAGQDTMEDFSDPVKDISDTAVRKTVEENQDLRRQVIYLQQTVEERERRIRALESLLVGERSCTGSSQQRSREAANTATQTEKTARPKSVGSSSGRSTSSSEDQQAFISPVEPRPSPRPPNSSRISRPLHSPLPLHTRGSSSPLPLPSRMSSSPLHTARRAESPRLARKPQSPRAQQQPARNRQEQTCLQPVRRAESPRLPPPPRYSSSRQGWLYSPQSGNSSGSEASTEGSTRCRAPRPAGAFPNILPRHRPTIL